MRRPRHDKKAAVALVRVSTGKQKLGPEAQFAAIRAWASREGVRIVAQFEERSVSGAADPTRREVLAAAVAALKAHRAAWFVVHESSRLARDVDLAGYFRTIVRMAGGEVVTTDGAGKSLLENRVRDLLGEQERREIAARTKRAMAVLRGQGRRVSRFPSFGFRFTATGRVVPDERERRIVARCRRLRRAGWTLTRIADRLNKTTRPRRGAKCWFPATVWTALREGPPVPRSR
ncbi:MAG: recombinase family protein [Planctomycetes bacterium]|nr:recombinase family protein [Planctomycetota bacterium]